jgi:hypothetical protein
MRIRTAIWSLLAGIVLPAVSQAAYVTGTIASVFAGPEQNFGVRFYINVTGGGVCNTAFVYTEPEAGSGHREKVSVFTAAYLAGKTVSMTVVSGRDGYCKLVEGSMY